MLRRVGLDAIVVGDRGLGRKELVIRLGHKGQELVFRIDPAILVRVPDLKEEILLAERVARQPSLGAVIGDRGDEGLDSLVLVTTLPVQTLADARGIARVDGHRWARETGFEPMHGWGQDRFMVRSCAAIDRLLWMVALAHARGMLALRDGTLAGFRDQAIRLLKQQAVLGRRLTVGKLAEAIGLDFDQHRRAWAHAWLL